MPVTNYIWDPVTSAYLMEKDGSGVTTAVYTQEPVPYGRLISQRRGGVTSYHHYDGLGSTRALTNSAQAVTDTNLYDAWGVNVASTGSTENPFKWLGAEGYYFDAATSNYYVRARNYEPTMGRWMSSDPLRFIDGPNLYRAYFVPDSLDSSGLSVLRCDNPCYGNGCGAEDAWIDAVPDHPLRNNFTPCCDAHDICYCQCGIDKADCDDQFEQCLRAICNQKFPDRGRFRPQPYRRVCMHLAGVYARAVRNLGADAFNKGQVVGCGNCRCVDDPIA